MGKLIGLVKYEWRWLICALTFLTVSAITSAMVPRYTSASIAAVIKAEQSETSNDDFKDSLRKLIIFALIAAYSAGCRGASFRMIGAKVDRRLRNDLFDKIMSQEVGFFDLTKTGDLTSRLTQDVSKVTEQIQMNVNIFTRTIFQVNKNRL